MMNDRKALNRLYKGGVYFEYSQPEAEGRDNCI